jgi:aminoglycoside 6'-N-acetyltransferase
MRLRPALISDLPVLRLWDEKAHVKAARGKDRPFDWEGALNRRVDWGELLIAESEGRPVAFLEIIDPAREDGHYWGSIEEGLRAIDIWIGEETDLGRGLGTRIMRLGLERCFADPRVEAVLLDPLAANTRVHRFYERLGFARMGPRRFGQDDCVVYRLDRSAWEQQSRKEVQSWPRND